MFDPHASQILCQDAQQVKIWQDEANIQELEAATAAVEGKWFQIELWQGKGGWTAKDFAAAKV